MDHELDLPTPHHRPGRDFAGTRFVRHRLAEADWAPFRVPGFERRETGIAEATGGIAGVQVARRLAGVPLAATRHDADILFGFLRAGSMELGVEGEEPARVSAGDSFVLPKGRVVEFREPSDDLEILEVALPGGFRTEVR